MMVLTRKPILEHLSSIILILQKGFRRLIYKRQDHHISQL